MNRTFLRKAFGAALSPLFGLVLLILLVTGNPRVGEAAEQRKNLAIPAQLQTELNVKVAYNDTRVFFLFAWPAEVGSIYHDYIHFEGGKWVKTKGSVPGIHPQKLYEDRVSFLLDDGSVRYFDGAGGFVTVHEEMRFLSSQASKEEVQKHPYLGKKRKKSDVRKYVPETRKSNDWRDVIRERDLEALRRSGVFLDLWMWRSHRSNPIGYADDLWVMDYRNSDQGKSPYTDNWDAENKRPKFMYDSSKVGFSSLRWDDVINHKLTQKDLYYLSSEFAVPFDPNREWKEGDTIPRRLLRIPQGSRADITGSGTWQDGKWRVLMKRLLDTGHSDDKALRDRRRYTIAFAVHKNYTGSRWHHVSLPYKLGMGVEADIVAHKFEGSEPPLDRVPWTRVSMFYPGQITWEFLVSRGHAGATGLRQGQSCGDCHSPDLLGQYAVEHELRDEVKARWYYTLASATIFLVGLGLASVIVSRRRS